MQKAETEQAVAAQEASHAKAVAAAQGRRQSQASRASVERMRRHNLRQQVRAQVAHSSASSLGVGSVATVASAAAAATAAATAAKAGFKPAWEGESPVPARADSKEGGSEEGWASPALKGSVASKEGGPSAAAKEAAATDIERLIAQLQANLGRVVDLFRSWDTDASGSVTKKEFRKGIASALRIEPTVEELAALFSFLDPDGSGSIDYRELDAKLHRRNVRHAA